MHGLFELSLQLLNFRYDIRQDADISIYICNVLTYKKGLLRYPTADSWWKCCIEA